MGYLPDGRLMLLELLDDSAYELDYLLEDELLLLDDGGDELLHGVLDE